MALLSLLLLAGLLADDPQASQPQTPASAQGQVQAKPLHEVIVVTAAGTPQEIGQAAALVTVLSKDDLTNSPALTLDDQLRDVPGFSLFRRSSSLVAHPTTQGVSLRGIGPSGAGRTLVMFDGIPVNDPFGGWVYWNRIPENELESIEIVRGAASGLYGSSAIGGAIQLLSRTPSTRVWTAEAQGGNDSTYDTATMFSEKRGRWGYTLSGRVFGTDGFYLIAPANRGKVDIPAHSGFQTFDGRVTYGDWHFGANLYREDRGNGTPVQVNNSHMELIDFGVKKERWQWNFYGQPGWFYSTFSNVAANRSTETLSLVQQVPTLALGSSVVGHFGSHFLAGADWRYDRANSNDQSLAGVFAQETLSLNHHVDLLAGGRFDGYQNRGTHGTFDPRLGLVMRAAESVTFRASIYRGFRAPTLNELYRPFQQGTSLTLPNSDLRAESLWGGEAGLDFHPTSWILFRVNGFVNALDNPVGNGPSKVISGVTTQTRTNIGGASVRGVEGDATAHHGRWMARASYLYSESTVDATSFWLVQAMRHQGSASVVWSGPVTITADTRLASRAFDNAQNTAILGGYSVSGFSARRVLTPRVEVFVAGENLMNRQIAVSRSPLEQLANPRLIHAGAKFRLSK